MKKISLFITAFLAVASSFAQIPNSGFESWTDMGSYKTPDGWDQLNAMTDSSGVFTCTQGKPGYAGSYYIIVVSQTVPGVGIVPGVAVSGALDKSNLPNVKPLHGFPFTGRPGKISAYWQYMAYGTDQGYITALLTKWNTAKGTRDTVAYVTQSLLGMEMSWATFSTNLQYFSNATPDSAMILLSASGATPVAGSYLYIDNLAFSGSATAVNNIPEPVDMIMLSPNPAKNASTLRFTTASAKPIEVALISLDGKILWTNHLQAQAGENSLPIDVSGIAAGVYMVNLSDGKQCSTQRLIVQ